MIQMTGHFLSETMEISRTCPQGFLVLKQKNCQIRILHPPKAIFNQQGTIVIFTEQGKQGARFALGIRTFWKFFWGGARREMTSEGHWNNRKEGRATGVINV